MRRGLLAAIAAAAQGNRLPEGVPWCADNGCFGQGYPGDAGLLRWLGEAWNDCAVFAVAPDVPFDAAATVERSHPFFPAIRRLGYPVALAAQNGMETLPVPDEWDVLFLGGDTAWKLSATARRLTRQAKALGKHVHMGRVNSLRRLRYAHATGCDSADGTYLAFGPDENLPRLLGWLRDVNHQHTLWEATMQP